MLCLRKKVRRNDFGVCTIVCDHQDLAGPCDGIDVDRTEDQTLRASDVDVAGADDFVDSSDRLRAVCDRANRLGPAGVDHLRDPGDDRSRQNLWSRVGRHENDALDARNGRGDGRHQDGGWVARLPARGVHGRSGHGLNPLAELDAPFFVAKPSIALVFVVATNALAGGFQRVPDGRIDLLGGFEPGLPGNDELRRPPPVEALGVVEHRFVTPLADRIENGAHVWFDASEILITTPAQRRERLFISGLGAFEDLQHFGGSSRPPDGVNRATLPFRAEGAPTAPS